MDSKNYVEINRKSWNARTAVHYDSEFYDNANFIKGKSSLNSIELDLLGDITGKSVLHLQCHFGQDTIQLTRLGAKATGVDLSDAAIDKARILAKETSSDAQFICCDVYDLPNHLDEKFDIVFTSYGTIGWLPDINKWANIVSQFLKPKGEFVFAEFHPVVWMFDDNFNAITYNYFNEDPILENIDGTYTDTDQSSIENQDYVSWNHGLSEVVTSLLNKNMEITALQEFDYSPYDCFSGTEEIAPKKFTIKKLGKKIPMVYAIKAVKK